MQQCTYVRICHSAFFYGSIGSYANALYNYIVGRHGLYTTYTTPKLECNTSYGMTIVQSRHARSGMPEIWPFLSIQVPGVNKNRYKIIQSRHPASSLQQRQLLYLLNSRVPFRWLHSGAFKLVKSSKPLAIAGVEDWDRKQNMLGLAERWKHCFSLLI